MSAETNIGVPVVVSSRLQKHLKEASFYCKIIELILCSVSTGLITEPLEKLWWSIDIQYVVIYHMSLCGYVLINAIFIMGYLMGERLPKKTSLMFTTMGAFLCFTAGLMLIRDCDIVDPKTNAVVRGEYSQRILTTGSFAISTAVVFGVDTYFTNKYA